MIEVWSWPTPNGHKVHIALEELGLEYKVIPVNIGAGDQFKSEFLKITANHRIPAVVDTDGPGGKPFTLFESAAVLIYLSEKTGGKLIPKDPFGRYKCLEWIMFQNRRRRPDVRPMEPFRGLRSRKNPLCDRALHERGETPDPGTEPSSRRGALARRRPIQHGRHHHLPADPPCRAVRFSFRRTRQHRRERVPSRQTLV